MINKETLKFLKDLKINNSKGWLEENRVKYDFAKNDILTLTEQLITAVSSFDKKILAANLEPKNCITRLNRDLRFAKDKTPYKNDYYIILNKDGKNSTSAFYYLHIEPGNCFIGGGLWNPQAEPLKKVRQEIDCSFDEWTTIINDKNFTKNFPAGIQSVGVLAKVPKGYDENNPASTFLKMKGFCTKENITDKAMMAADIKDKIITAFKTTKPLVDFLNKEIENE
jgi:uncharacterized protein (TIGR02453 family)